MSTRPLTRILLVGGAGRVGARLQALASTIDGMSIVGMLARDQASAAKLHATEAARQDRSISHEIKAFSRGEADVIIDFSSPDGSMRALELARHVDAALLVGTTGLSAATIAALREESTTRAVMHAPNTSLGVAALAEAVRRIASRLAKFDVSIVESHHSAKRDAPSGTAIRLARAARDGGATLRDDQILAIRGGDVVGEHTVRFAGAGEYVELTHRATSRDVFVVGALKAAAWLASQKPGWWSIEHSFAIEAQ
ncbi:MAG: 4-hydroxy-tetrahydrodipicolinate reductase [Phycisphaerales bacterium]